MDTGHRKLLRDISLKFKENKSRLDLLRWIDREIINEESNINLFFDTLRQRLMDLFNFSEMSAYVLVNGHFQPITSRSLPLTFTPDVITHKDWDGHCHLETDTESGQVVMFVGVHTTEAPRVLLVFEDDYVGEPISIIHDDDFQEFSHILSGQIKIFLNDCIRRKFDRHLETVVKAYFDVMTNREDSHTESWVKIVDMFANFLPDWQPFKLTEPPLVQILSYRSDMPDVMELQASRIGETDPLPMQVGKLLLKDETICGLYLQRTELGKLPEGHLIVDPTDTTLSKYYKSILLFDETPRSELVVPIIYDEELVGLINLEHPEPDVFCDYHIDIIKRAASSISSVTRAILAEEDGDYANAYSLRYVLSKILDKMGRIYRHKIRQDIQNASFAVGNLAKFNEGSGDDQDRLYGILKNALKSIDSLSSSYFANVPDFVVYSPRLLWPIVEDATKDFAPADMERSEDIKIVLEPPSTNIEVIASLLMREHIYNVINNSLYAIRQRFKAGDISKGRIVISVSEEKSIDRGGNRASYDLAVVSVKDNGGGVLSHLIPKLFKAGVTTKSKDGGTGFGLNAARNYMRELGGDVTLENNNEGGATVRFLSPIYNSHYHDALIARLNNINEVETRA